MNHNRFARHLAAGTYELIILDVLREGPAYGYGIIRRIAKQSRNQLQWLQGTVYPVLHRLENRRWIKGEWDRSRRGRERRYYRLTPRGRAAWREQRQHWKNFARAVAAVLGIG
jgi:transcriptional regulator